MKTFLITLILSVCCIQMTYAQDARYYVAYEKYGKNRKSSLYGYRDAKTRDIVIPAQYAKASTWFSEGLAAVKVDKKWGFIDAKGEIAIPFQYDYAENFRYGMAFVRIGKEAYLIDKNGRFLNAGLRTHGNYGDGRIPVEEIKNGTKPTKKFGFIDLSGKIVIPCQYDDVGSFFDGYAYAGIGGVSSNKYHGYIDTNGKYKVIANQQANYMGLGRGPMRFSEGLVRVQDRESSKIGFADTLGHIVIPCEYTVADNFAEGLAQVSIQSGKWGTVWKSGYIDRNGDVVIPITFDRAGRFKEGLAPVMVNNLYGYINKSGNFVIEPQFKMAKEFKNGLAVVSKPYGDDGYRYGYIDTTGKLVLPCTFIEAYDFDTDGFAIVATKRTGEGIPDNYIIDRNGNRVDTPEGVKKWR